MTSSLYSSKIKLFFLPFVYYYTLSISMLVLSMYLISKSPNLGVKISLAATMNNPAEQDILHSYVEEVNLSVYTEPQVTEIVPADTKIDINCKTDEAQKIDSFFKSQKSPLEGFGCEFSSQATVNSLNPYLVPAIAMCESGGGKNVTYEYNAWGWGIYSSKEATLNHGAQECDSWEHCIGRVSRGISKKSSLGTTPKDIVQWYNGGNKEKWVNCVDKYIDKISNYNL